MPAFVRINVSVSIFLQKICNSEIHVRLYICLILLVHLPPQSHVIPKLLENCTVNFVNIVNIGTISRFVAIAEPLMNHFLSLN